MKYLLLFAAFLAAPFLHAQELYPYTEPASNMPAHSISAKFGAMYGRDKHDNRLMQRYSPEVMFGINKAWMVHAAVSISNMHQTAFIGESVRVYAKYRFLSNDDVHKHFRMAAFALGSYSRNHLDHNEVNLSGDQSGVQAGLIATQLVNKFAVSATASIAEILNEGRWDKSPDHTYAWEAFDYSLSAGYLLFPLQYKSYDQTNINLYAEWLGSRNLGWPAEKGFVDLAPSLQAIFKSTSKISIGYRFQLAGDVDRLSNNGFMVSYERIFLGALRRKN